MSFGRILSFFIILAISIPAKKGDFVDLKRPAYEKIRFRLQDALVTLMGVNCFRGQAVF